MDGKRFPLAGVVGLLVVGTALGVGHNYMGLKAERWGIPWKGVPIDDLVDREVQDFDPAAHRPDPTESDDPLFGAFENAGPNLPQIVDTGRPVQVSENVVKAFVDHGGGAILIDAREPEEYAEGHIPGAVNHPYDEVITDPAFFEDFETGGLPLIIYCGGPECEISKNLALEFYLAHKRPVAFYEAGIPRWQERGFPLVEGSEP